LETNSRVRSLQLKLVAGNYIVGSTNTT